MSSAKTPAPQHTLLQTRDTMSARARTTAGSRERGRPRAVPGVLCENHLRGVSMCSKKDGRALFCEAEALPHGPVRLDAGKGAEPLLHLRRHVRLAPLCTGLSWLVITSTIASCHWLIASRFCDRGHHDVLLHDDVLCDSGHRELHRLPTLPPRWWLRSQSFDTAVHGVDEQTETLSPFGASGWPSNTTRPDTWPWEQKTSRLCTAPLETGLLIQSSMMLRSSTNDERCECALHDKQLQHQKHLG